MFYTDSFEIYRTASGFVGDNRGLFDYVPPGCGLQANIVDLWRKYFVLEEDMLELDLPILTPEDAFKTSGHVDKFSDWMCKDPIKEEYIRADHLVEGVLEARLRADEKTREMDNAQKAELKSILARCVISSPVSTSATLTATIVIQQITRLENVREYTPNVIEPSFGIGRIVYALLEHLYWHRTGKPERGVLSLPLSVAPTKILLAPLSSNPSLDAITQKLSSRLRALGIDHRVDISGASICKRYARHDELGTPLGVTVDFDTVKDGTLTLRDRDSTGQVRGSENEIVTAVQSLLAGKECWSDATARLPGFNCEEEG